MAEVIEVEDGLFFNKQYIDKEFDHKGNTVYTTGRYRRSPTGTIYHKCHSNATGTGKPGFLFISENNLAKAIDGKTKPWNSSLAGLRRTKVSLKRLIKTGRFADPAH